jgi:hypothetical protein
MSDLLFDPPWWLPTGIVAVGGYLFWSGNRKQDKMLRNTGLVGVLLAIVLMVVARLVDTPKEVAIGTTKLLVQSAGKGDWTTFGSILDPSTTALGVYRGKQQLTDGAQRTAENIELKSANVTSIAATQNQSLITVDVSVLSQQEKFPYPYPSNWRFEWQNSGNGWYLATISFLPSAQLSPDQVNSRLVKPPKP